MYTPHKTAMILFAVTGLLLYFNSTTLCLGAGARHSILLERLAGVVNAGPPLEPVPSLPCYFDATKPSFSRARERTRGATAPRATG